MDANQPLGLSRTAASQPITKAALRTMALAQRAAIDPAEQIRHNHSRTSHLLDWFTNSPLAPGPGATVALYLSRADEPDTIELATKLHAAGWRLLTPKMQPATTTTGRCQPAWGWFTGTANLSRGRFGIPDSQGPLLPPQVLSSAAVVLVPALLLTPTGQRLGRGGGWFDEALGWASPDVVSIGIVNSIEVVPTLPHEAHDRLMTTLATELGVQAVVN